MSMINNRLVAVLFIVIFINPYAIYAKDTDSALFATYNMNCIWRVYSDGNIEKVSCFQDTPFWYRGNIYYGNNSPRISPDQRCVAVIRKDDLWLFKTDTKKIIRVTQVAKPRTEKYLSIEVNTITWSWDSSKLLYSVSSGDPGSGDDGVDRKVRPAKYGFYIYDVKAKSSKFISESDKLVPNFNRVILEWPQDGTTLINGNKINSELEDIDISPDSKWLVARAEKPNKIVKIDLKDYNIIPLSPIGEWAEYEWPKYSPSGKHIFYTRRNGLDNGSPIKNIMVDGKKIYTSAGLSDYSWIDDNTIVFTSRSKNSDIEIVIIDSVTGEIKGKQKIGKAQ